MRTFWQAFKILRGALIFTFFYVSGAVFGLLVLPIVSALTPGETQRIKRVHRVVTGAFRFVLDLLRWARIFDFDARRVTAIHGERPVLVIVNHPTTIDVVAILSVYRDAVVVIKDKIWRDPFLRYLFSWTGHIHGGDGSLEAGLRVLEQIRERLEQGFDVVVFPEGTRSPPHGLAPFMKGAFAIATQTKTDIVPVVLTANPPALHKDAPWHALPDVPVRYELTPKPIVEVAGRSTKLLLRDVTEIYMRELGCESGERVKAAEAAE